jgi:hypothetical protein
MSYATQRLLILTTTSIENEVRRQIEGLWEDQHEALEQIVLKEGALDAVLQLHW